MRNLDKLKGAILDKFGTYTKFSEASGYSPPAISQKISGKVRFTQDDIEVWAGLIGIKKSEYGEYFF